LSKRIFLGLVWVLIVSGILGLSAAYVRPVFFWPLAVIAIPLPAICLVLFASLPFLALARKWIPFVVGLLVIVFTGSRHISLDRITRPVPSDADLVLMSYNAPKEPDENWARRQVTALVASVAPDVIALQESVVWAMKNSPDILRSHRKFERVIDSLGYRVEMPPEGGPANARWTHWKPPVLLRFEPDDQQQIEPESPTDRMGDFSILRTVLTWQGRQMAVYNFHLSSHGTSKPWKKEGGIYSPASWLEYLREMRRGFQIRENQVSRLKEILKDEELPLVVVGDFNSTPDSWTYAQLADGLQDAYRSSGSAWGSTYHSKRPLVRIDFVLLGPEFDPVDAYVVNDYPRSSDHRPLVARFRWK
jgi:endonuclease/exonuclease/phosphatase family metal-dependent hydrolase